MTLYECLKKGFEDFFYTCDADVYCLQEVKALKEQECFVKGVEIGSSLCIPWRANLAT